MTPSGPIVVVGSVNMDIVVPVPRLPGRGETISGGDSAFYGGGKGANQACAARKLGALVTMIGEVGSDPFGTALVSGLKQVGVDVTKIGTAERPSGCASIYALPDGQNAIAISPGANAMLDPETALARLNALPHPAAVLLQLEIPLETVEATLDWCREHGVRTILDPAPAPAASSNFLEKASILTPNQTEAAYLIGESSPIADFAEAEKAAAILFQPTLEAVVIKLGPLGCLVRTADGTERVNGYSVTAVDTTAAGDAFNGGLAVALAEGRSIVEAAAFANAVAAISVTRHGAQASLPDRGEADRFMERDRSVVIAGAGAI